LSTRPRSGDIAALVGVSQTTVSFVLNGKQGHVSDETRRRVLEAAEALGYHVNAPARKLASGRTQTLGLVIRQSSEKVAGDPFLGATLKGLASVARGLNYQVIVESLGPGEGTYESLLRAQHVDALVISGTRDDDEELVRLVQDGYPLVLQGSRPDLDVPSVDVDNAAAARVAVEYMIDRGHRRIACVVHDLAYSAAQERLKGYRAALTAAGIEFDRSLVVAGGWDATSGREAMASLLERETFTGVFVAFDMGAVGALAAIRSAGLSVPGDLSLVGFDDIPIAEFLDPPLTTIHVPAFELGAALARVLLDRLEGRPVTKRTILETHLVARSSVGAIPNRTPEG
jgi:DNA-binding LacI/PurR family transcriptional regulator